MLHCTVSVSVPTAFCPDIKIKKPDATFGTVTFAVVPVLASYWVCPLVVSPPWQPKLVVLITGNKRINDSAVVVVYATVAILVAPTKVLVVFTEILNVLALALLFVINSAVYQECQKKSRDSQNFLVLTVSPNLKAN